jgi:hypothetical protein
MRLLISLLSLLVVANALTKDAAFETIKNDIELQNKQQDRGKLSSENTCTMNDSEKCPLSDMTEDISNLVLPGGETRCIFSTSSPYGFQVIKGDSDKLLVYFQGGGACWDKVSTVTGMCTTDANPQRNLVGVFNRTSDQNRFKDYTIVQALYCSGDVFGGNVTRSYNDRAGQPVIQSGIQNAQATLDWIVKQQANGGLAATLSDVVVMGCSAGSIGAQLWGPIILKTLPWKQAAIIPDSYAGVFPPDSQGIYVSMYPCIYLSIYLYIYLCIYLSIYLCIYLSIYLCIYLIMNLLTKLSISYTRTFNAKLWILYWTIFNSISKYVFKIIVLFYYSFYCLLFYLLFK